MQGSISFDGTLSGGITGGGGGSNVEITPTLSEGTKIADYTIDGDSGELYAPESGSDVTITPTVQSGTKIADYTIGGDSGELYAPTPQPLPGTIVTKALRKYNDDTQTKIMTITTLDTENDIEISQDIYAPSGGSSAINYSTTEQDTGIKWTDGRSIYQLSIVCDRQYSMTTNGYLLGQVIDELANADCIIYAFGIMPNNKKFVQFDSADITVSGGVNKLRVYLPKAQTFNIGDVITIKYLKVVTP